MTELASIAATALGIILEFVAVVALARLIDAQLPARTLMICFGVGIGLSSLIVLSVGVGLTWGIEPVLAGFLLLALIPTTSLGAYTILAIVQWFNRRDGPASQPPHPESRRPT